MLTRSGVWAKRKGAAPTSAAPGPSKTQANKTQASKSKPAGRKKERAVKVLRNETLDLEVVQASGYPCVRLSGEGNCDGSLRLSETLAHLVESGYRRLVLDTRELIYLD